MPDTGKIGKAAAQIMDTLERAIGDDPSAEIGEVGIVVEVKRKQTVSIHTYCTEDRPHVQEAIFRAGMRSSRGEPS